MSFDRRDRDRDGFGPDRRLDRGPDRGRGDSFGRGPTGGYHPYGGGNDRSFSRRDVPPAFQGRDGGSGMGPPPGPPMHGGGRPGGIPSGPAPPQDPFEVDREKTCPLLIRWVKWGLRYNLSIMHPTGASLDTS